MAGSNTLYIICYTLVNVPHMYSISDDIYCMCSVLGVLHMQFRHMQYMCGILVIHMFDTCNKGIYRTTCIIQLYILHMYYMHVLHIYYTCITHVSDIPVCLNM